VDKSVTNDVEAAPTSIDIQFRDKVGT